MYNARYMYGYQESYAIPRLLRRHWLKVRKHLVAEKHRIDAVAVRGASGLLMAGMISTQLRIPPIIVRIGKGSSHGPNEIVGPPPDKVRTFMIVDDLVDSGDTIRTIVKEVHRHYCHARYLGCLLYREPALFYPPDEARKLER